MLVSLCSMLWCHSVDNWQFTYIYFMYGTVRSTYKRYIPHLFYFLCVLHTCDQHGRGSTSNTRYTHNTRDNSVPDMNMSHTILDSTQMTVCDVPTLHMTIIHYMHDRICIATQLQLHNIYIIQTCSFWLFLTLLSTWDVKFFLAKHHKMAAAANLRH